MKTRQKRKLKKIEKQISLKISQHEQPDNFVPNDEEDWDWKTCTKNGKQCICFNCENLTCKERECLWYCCDCDEYSGDILMCMTKG